MYPLKLPSIFIFCLVVAGCATNRAVSAKTSCVWREVTREAQFPQGYNYRVFVRNGEMSAINGGGWRSTDGKNWTKTGLTAWVFGDQLFMTGGKYSYAEPDGTIKFVYRNDVWAMRRKNFRFWTDDLPVSEPAKSL